MQNLKCKNQKDYVLQGILDNFLLGLMFLLIHYYLVVQLKALKARRELLSNIKVNKMY